MDVISQFIENYKRRYNFYETAGRLAARQLENALQSSGIRAVVVSRAKNPARLKNKVILRNESRETPYKNMNEIYEDIADLSGVRVSLYFPGDRVKVDKQVNQLFDILETKNFQGQSRQLSYCRRFSGYWATHYRAAMKEETLNSPQKKYASARIEIQVASVLMLAWSEVEHDLIYKPLSGSLSDEELSILDELNGLALIGESALERLQKAGNERIQNKNTTFNSQYDLASYLYNFLSSKYKQDNIELRMGNVELLFKLMCRLKIMRVKDIEPILKSLRLEKDRRTISEQIIDQLISGSEKRYVLYSELRATQPIGDENISIAVNEFMRQWIGIENLLNKVTSQANPKACGTFNINTLKRMELLDKETLNKIIALRKLRNALVHSIETPEAEYIQRQVAEARRILAELPAKLSPAGVTS